jgi:type II secretory pathway pseudopilin PulG
MAERARWRQRACAGAENPRRLRDEAGDTLVEIVVTVMIMSVAVVGIIAGIASAISLSGLHRSQADVSAALVSAAETVKATGYIGCCNPATGGTNNCNSDPVGTLNTLLSNTQVNSTGAPLESDVAVPSVKSVTDVSGKSCTGLSNDPGTGSGLATDPGIEMVWLQATSNTGKVTQNLYVIKGDN